MKKAFHLSIPKPCHENWSIMTPNEKGRFCKLCTKTVVDFTNKTDKEIQDYVLDNKDQRICGHFYKKQLDSLTIEIPEEVFYQKLSFSKVFLLVLLITMGTTLLSCKHDGGKVQKIDHVILLDSIEKHNDSITRNNLIEALSIEKDSVQLPQQQTEKDSIIEDVTIEGEIIIGLIVPPENEDTCNWFIVDEPPRFKGGSKGTREEMQKNFSNSIAKFVNKNFNTHSAINLEPGKKKIYSQFTIDITGNITDIKVRAPYKLLEEETIRVLELLPEFIPGKHRNKPINVKYTLPITFEVE